MKNNKFRKLIYEFDMPTYFYYVKIGFFPIKNKRGEKVLWQNKQQLEFQKN
jgi:hypothetical protein